MFSEFCDQMQNRLIFPAISSIFICLLYYVDNWYYRLMFAGIFLFFLLKEKSQVACMGLICSFLVLFSCWMKETEPIDYEKKTERIVIVPDSVKANGDLITFVGHTTDNQKIHLSYQAKSEKERNLFLLFKSQAVEMVVSGDYQFPEKERNEFAFDQVSYDKFHRISGRFRIMRVNETVNKNSWKNFLIRKRGMFVTFIQDNFPNKTSVYMNALLFGYKDTRFLESEETFKETGLLHLFSLSGMHIQTYLGWVYYLFRRGGLTLQASFVPMFLLTISYLVLAGGSISVVRAGCLFLLKLGLKLFQVKLSSMDCFSITLWVLLLIEPLWLFRVGGQLSLLMSFLLILLPLNKGTRIEKGATIFLFSIGILPIIAWHFYEWAVLGSVFTALLSPIFIHFLLPFMVFIFVFGSCLPLPILELIEYLIQGFESLLDFLRFSNMVIGRPNFWLMMVGIFFIFWVIERQQNKPLHSIFYASCILCMLLLSRFFQLESSITFSDVGQGDSIFLSAPFQKETVMIDTGGKLVFEKEEWQKRSGRSYAEYNIIPFLKGKGINRINKLILTHNDMDHVGELETLAKHVKIDSVYIGWGSGNIASLNQRLNVLRSRGTKIYEVKQGDQINGYFDFFVLSPDRKGLGRNEDSIGLLLAHQTLRFLFLGDLDQMTDERIGKTYPNLKADVIKLGHHGSRTSSSPKFLEQLEATYGIISCGMNNRYGHPHQEVLDVMATYQLRSLRTDQQGAISFKWHPIWSPNGRIQTRID